MDVNEEELYKDLFDKLQISFADTMKDDKCIKLFTEGYKKGFNEGYKAAIEDVRTKMCQIPPQISQNIGQGQDGTAQPQWWPWW